MISLETPRDRDRLDDGLPTTFERKVNPTPQGYLPPERPEGFYGGSARSEAEGDAEFDWDAIDEGTDPEVGVFPFSDLDDSDLEDEA